MPPSSNPYEGPHAPATGDDRHVDWIGVPLRQRRWLKVRPYVRGAALLATAAVLVALLMAERESEGILAIGDCLNTPGENSVVADLTTVPCSEPHNAEVFGSTRHPGGAFPGEGVLFDWASVECRDRVDDYTGSAWFEAPAWVNTLIPTEASWSDGDRAVTCLLVPAPGDPLLVGSLRE